MIVQDQKGCIIFLKALRFSFHEKDLHYFKHVWNKNKCIYIGGPFFVKCHSNSGIYKHWCNVAYADALKEQITNCLSIFVVFFFQIVSLPFQVHVQTFCTFVRNFCRLVSCSLLNAVILLMLVGFGFLRQICGCLFKKP